MGAKGNFIREITGVGRLVGREPLNKTRTHACTTGEQTVRVVGEQTNKQRTTIKR
jgi:hypothetical protein